MNLVETLIGGVIFGLASMGSLRIYSSTLQATYGHDQRQALDGAMDIILGSVHQSLNSQAAAGISGDAGDSPDCGLKVKEQLVDALRAQASSANVSFELNQQHGLLKLVLRGTDLPSRQRWFSPAAYGLCGNTSSTTTYDHDAKTGQGDGLHADRSLDGSQFAGPFDGFRSVLEPGALGPVADRDGGTTPDGGTGARP